MLNTCLAQTIKTQAAKTQLNPNEKLFNAKKYQLDSAFNKVLIIDKKFDVRFYRCADTTSDREGALAIEINDADTKTIAYSHTFQENQYALYKKSGLRLDALGVLYLELVFDGGGSGYSGTLYQINIQGNTIAPIEILHYGELSAYLFSKSNNDILLFNGIWGSAEDESHFSDHLYTVTKYSFEGLLMRRQLLGTTQKKYESVSDNKTFLATAKEIQQREPKLLRNIDLPDFEGF